jgi:hypothetical protein
MQVQQWGSWDFSVSGNFVSATFLVHDIDPNVTVVTDVSLAWHFSTGAAAFANIDSITFSNGTVITPNVPSFMEPSPVPSKIVNILYSVNVGSQSQARASIFFLGLV